MLMVFCEHAYPQIFDKCGGCAVTGFLILSGFCMYLSYGEKVEKQHYNHKNFLVKKCIHFYPIHWFTLLLAWGIGMNFAYSLTSGWFIKLGLNASLLHSWIPNRNVYFSYNSPSWYLCDILLFYISFPFLCKFINKLSFYKNILFIIFIFILYTLSLHLFNSSDWNAFFYVQPLVRLIDCYLGMSLARLYLRICNNEIIKKNIEKNVVCLDILLIIQFAVVIYQSIYRPLGEIFYMSSMWPTLIILIFLICIRSFSLKHSLLNSLINNKIISWLGGISFYFYIFHAPILWGGKRIAGYLNNTDYSVVVIVCFVLITIIAFCGKKINENIILPKLCSLFNIK